MKALCPQEWLCAIRAKYNENLCCATIYRGFCPANWTLIFAPVCIDDRQSAEGLNPNLMQGRLGYLRVGRAGIHPRIKRKVVATLSLGDGDLCLESSHAAIVHATIGAAIISLPLLVVP